VVDDNNRWLGALGSAGLVRLAGRYTLARMMEREDFRTRFAEGLPPVMALRQRIEQVAINLIQNACDALQGNGAAVEVSTALTGEGFPSFTVRDEGRGMSAEELQKILTPFYTSRRESGGTGLGLFVSTNIVRKYGGELLFASEPGKGTTVTAVFKQEPKL